MTHRFTLERRNNMPPAEFVAALGDVFEQAVRVAEQTADGRPYPTIEALHDGLTGPSPTQPPTSRACGSQRLPTGRGMPKIDGQRSTHVLDTASGRPASGVRLALYEVGASTRIARGDAHQCRWPQRRAPDERWSVRIGLYELQFHVGSYFASRQITAADPPFLDIVPVRFSIAEPEGLYHVPLLVTSWSYATYRGS